MNLIEDIYNPALTTLYYRDFVSVIEFLNGHIFPNNRLPELIFQSLITANFSSQWSRFEDDIVPSQLNEFELTYYYLYLGCFYSKNKNWIEAYKALSAVRDKLNIWLKWPNTYSYVIPTTEKDLGKFTFINSLYWSIYEHIQNDFRNHFKAKEYTTVLALYENIKKHDNFYFNIPEILLSLLFLRFPDKTENIIGIYSEIITTIYNLQSSARKKYLLTRKPELSMEENLAINIKCHAGNWVYTFGKYNGLSIKEVLQIDPEEVWRCVIELINFTVSHYVFFDDSITKSEKFYQALEINVAKWKASEAWEWEMEGIAAYWDANSEEDWDRTQEMWDAARDEERSMDEESGGTWHIANDYD